jgi:hypothetical protein
MAAAVGVTGANGLTECGDAVTDGVLLLELPGPARGFRRCGTG